MMSGAIASLTRAGIAPSADSARKWISGGRPSAVTTPTGSPARTPFAQYQRA